MCEYQPTVLLWLRQTKSAHEAKQVQALLAGLSGVLGVLPSIRRPKLILVKYDQNQITSQTLLRAARVHDQNALLVGI